MGVEMTEHKYLITVNGLPREVNQGLVRCFLDLEFDEPEPNLSVADFSLANPKYIGTVFITYEKHISLVDNDTYLEKIQKAKDDGYLPFAVDFIPYEDHTHKFFREIDIACVLGYPHISKKGIKQYIWLSFMNSGIDQNSPNFLTGTKDYCSDVAHNLLKIAEMYVKRCHERSGYSNQRD